MDRLRVLVVDDEDELVSTVCERLTLRGIEADGVLTGAAALERIRAKEFDVAVVDVKMPGMDGLEVMRKIKALRPEIQVILLTGHGSVKESKIGLQEGAFDYLIKPINIEALIGKMREAVSGLA